MPVIKSRHAVHCEDSDEDVDEVCEENTDEGSNWHTSPFYIGNFFIKQPDSSAQCATCKMRMKTTQGNTSGLANDLFRKHSKVYELFKVKKAEVESKRAELREASWKRRVLQDIIKSKQIKLEIKSGVLYMN